NVPRTRSAWYHKQRVCPHVGMRGVLHRLRHPRIAKRDNWLATPQSRGKTKTTSLSLYLRFLGCAQAEGGMY
ncbi:MAG TPA: hypothetical protein PLW35_08600, partial [Verrucomicrobiota bacterium]|nr:hypothetical protein [Verrucomicrobiota bacterium]